MAASVSAAYFTEAQRQATKDAARIAGLDVFPSIIEPIAAVIAYGLDKKEGGKNILVYDLGGSIFGVTILFAEDELIMVLAISGDAHLGEEYFLQRVVEYFIKRILEKLGKDISNDSKDLDKLQRECERATRSLNSQTSVVVRVELSGGIVFSEGLTRAKFEELNAELFEKMMPLVGEALTQAKLKNTEIHEIVLVGGGTKIPKVQQLLKNMFNGKEPNKGVDPEEVVAYGAAVRAGKETKGTINEKDELSHKIDSYKEKINVNETGLKEAI